MLIIDNSMSQMSIVFVLVYQNKKKTLWCILKPENAQQNLFLISKAIRVVCYSNTIQYKCETVI